MRTKSSSVDEFRYLKDIPLGKDIYVDEVKRDLVCPFNLDIEPMDKLILFDVEDDPLYETIELQEFDDEISKGLVILLYRKDNEVDVYYTKGIKHDFYKGSKNGINQMFTPEQYIFEKRDDQFIFNLEFNDKDGKKILVKATETNPDKKYFNILAPAGDMIDNFTSFPLFFMQETAFLEKNYSTIEIEIGGENRQPVFIPIAINNKFVYLSRYCLDPVAVSLNENYKGVVKPTENDLLINTNRYEIKGLSSSKYDHNASIKFSPAIPEILSLKNGVKIEGRFSTSVDNTTGILAGDYLIEKNNGEVTLSLAPKKGWQPMPGKKWFKKYKWISTVNNNESTVTVDSKWILEI